MRGREVLAALLALFIFRVAPVFAQNPQTAQALIVNVESASMREGPSANATITGTLFRGEQLEVLGTSGDWYHVRVRNSARTGWVNKAVVRTFVLPPAPPGAPSAVQQARRPPPRFPRGLVSINAAYQATSTTVTDTGTQAANAETASTTVTQHVGAAPAFDVSGHALLQGRSGISIGFSRFQRKENADISAAIPHPFFFNQPRTLSAQEPMLRQENALYIDVMVLLSLTRKVDLVIFGGPTVFWINNDFVSKVNYSDEYPYDAVTFTSATIVQSSKTAAGLNGGADVSFALSRNAGVGGFVRYSGARVDIANAAGTTMRVTVGGLQAGGGVRLRF